MVNIIFLKKKHQKDMTLNPERMYFEIKENGEVVKCNNER
jgi:hypothetical protein